MLHATYDTPIPPSSEYQAKYIILHKIAARSIRHQQEHLREFQRLRFIVRHQSPIHKGQNRSIHRWLRVLNLNLVLDAKFRRCRSSTNPLSAHQAATISPCQSTGTPHPYGGAAHPFTDAVLLWTFILSYWLLDTKVSANRDVAHLHCCSDEGKEAQDRNNHLIHTRRGCEKKASRVGLNNPSHFCRSSSKSTRTVLAW